MMSMEERTAVSGAMIRHAEKACALAAATKMSVAGDKECFDMLTLPATGDLRKSETTLRSPQAPSWLLKDQCQRKRAVTKFLCFVGQVATITAVDEFGHFWIGFGTQVDDGEDSDTRVIRLL